MIAAEMDSHRAAAFLLRQAVDDGILHVWLYEQGRQGDVLFLQPFFQRDAVVDLLVEALPLQGQVVLQDLYFLRQGDLPLDRCVQVVAHQAGEAGQEFHRFFLVVP